MVDHMRENSVEAGFLKEDASITDLLDAIDQTLRGSPVMAQYGHGTFIEKGPEEIYPDELDEEVKI